MFELTVLKLYSLVGNSKMILHCKAVLKTHRQSKIGLHKKRARNFDHCGAFGTKVSSLCPLI